MRPYRRSNNELPVRPYSYQRPVYPQRRAVRSLFSLGIRGDFSSDRNALLGPAYAPIQSSSQNVNGRGLPAFQNPRSIKINKGKAALNSPTMPELDSAVSKHICNLIVDSTTNKIDVSKIGKSSSWSDSYLCAIKHLANNIKKATIDRISKFIYPVKQSSESSSEFVSCESTSAKRILNYTENTSSLIVPEAMASTSDSANQGKRKLLAKTATIERMPKRRRCFSPKLSRLPTPSTDCKYTVKKTAVKNRMSAGHFSAWGVEDDEVRYYMQKCTGDGDRYSEEIAVAPRTRQEAPKSPQQIRNSSDNCVNGFTISPFRAISTRDKQKHFATWMRSNSKTNPKTLFYTHFEEKRLNVSEDCSPKEPNACQEKSLPNSPEIWTCDTCSFLNKAPSVRCWVCDVIKYGVITQSCVKNPANEMSSDKCGVTNRTATAQQNASVGDASTSSGLSDTAPSRPKPRPVGILMGKWARRKYLKREGDCMDLEFTCPTPKVTMTPEVVKSIQAVLNQPIHYNWFLYI